MTGDELKDFWQAIEKKETTENKIYHLGGTARALANEAKNKENPSHAYLSEKLNIFKNFSACMNSLREDNGYYAKNTKEFEAFCANLDQIIGLLEQAVEASAAADGQSQPQPQPQPQPLIQTLNSEQLNARENEDPGTRSPPDVEASSDQEPEKREKIVGTDPKIATIDAATDTKSATPLLATPKASMPLDMAKVNTPPLAAPSDGVSFGTAAWCGGVGLALGFGGFYLVNKYFLQQTPAGL